MREDRLIHWSLCRRISLIILFIGTSITLFGQYSRFAPVNIDDSLYQATGKKMIIPALLAGYGFSQFTIDPVVDLNLRIRNKITSRISQPFRIDDYSQYSPAVAVYGLNLLGINGKHNFLDRSIILGTSAVIAGVSVSAIKYLTAIQRPDGGAFNAFPSAHTATAFACAEFLFREYREVSVWYGIAGYTIAAGTGFMRMHNNQHWLTDVVAGAGFGILSTKLAYWAFPKLKRLLFKDINFRFSLIPAFKL